MLITVQWWNQFDKENIIALQSISRHVEEASIAYLDAVAVADPAASGKMAFPVAVAPSQMLCHLGRAPVAQADRSNILNLKWLF